MNWQIHVANQAERNLKRLPRDDIKRIEKTIDLIELNPFSGDIEKMTGKKDIWRRRVGSYRITYEISTKEKLVKIHNIKRRTSRTYK